MGETISAVGQKTDASKYHKPKCKANRKIMSKLFPDQWKTVELILIAKSHKDDKSILSVSLPIFMPTSN